ncbi:uncharacterized protein LOC119735042 [Patiria miniata]|uniref:Uncharacterized protein n=1 Tax=Patiria miniata TaxID=46514 RepID=A0A914AMK1_PATMI|nr:uncharacterized protein LOC119735042 [Patiria miniata]
MTQWLGMCLDASAFNPIIGVSINSISGSVRASAEKTTEVAGSSGQEAIRGEPTTGPIKPIFGRGKRVSSGRGHWELFREIKFEGCAHSCYLAIAARDDEIAVADMYGNRVVIFSIDGKQKSTIQLQKCPRGIAVEPIHNRFVVIETYDPKVKVFNSDNSLAYEFPTVPADEVGKPHSPRTRGVAVKKDGTILVTYDQGWVYTEHKPSNGELLRTVPVKLCPAQLAVDNKDRVIISNYGARPFVAVTDGSSYTLFTIEPTILGKPAKYCLDVYADSSG